MSDRPDEEDLVKVLIPLRGVAAESGFESESVWAQPLGGDRYLIWNLPVFAHNIEMRSVVKCAADPGGGLPVVTTVVSHGDIRGVRVCFEPGATEEQIDQVLELFAERRALSERYGRELWAFGMRSAEDYAWVGPALEPYVEQGILWFESNIQPDEPGYEAHA